MTMTKQRKSLQDKLRRKFGWRSDWCLSSGTTSLCKDKATNFSLRKASTDLVVTFSPRKLWNELVDGKSYNRQGIAIELQQYDDSLEHPKLIKALFTSITFEELELIYNIAKEKRQEVISEHIDTKGE